MIFENLFQKLESIIAQSRDILGINHYILVDEPFLLFKQNILNNDIERAALCANTMLYSIKKIEQYKLHINFGLALLEVIKAIGNAKHVASIHMQLAVSFDMEHKFSESEKHFLEGVQSITPYVELGDAEAIKILASLWYNRCQQVRNGETKHQLRTYAEKALALNEQIDYKRGIMLCLNVIATLLERNEVENKIALYQRMIDIANEVGDNLMVVLAQLNIGNAEVEKGNVEYGIKLIEYAIKEIEKAVSWRYAALASLDLAEAYILAGRYQDANSRCLFAQEVFLKNNIVVYNERLNSLIAKIQQHVKP
jgi:tetratricopeptide (TPR) repeat protein